MPRASRPPSLPPDFLDGLHDAIQRVSAVADLLAFVGTAVDPGLLRESTIAEAAGIIGDEAQRMLELIRARDPAAFPESTES